MKWKWKLNMREADDTGANQLVSQLRTTANGTALDDSKMKRKVAAGESVKNEAKSGSRKKCQAGLPEKAKLQMCTVLVHFWRAGRGMQSKNNLPIVSQNIQTMRELKFLGGYQ